MIKVLSIIHMIVAIVYIFLFQEEILQSNKLNVFFVVIILFLFSPILTIAQIVVGVIEHLLNIGEDSYWD